MLPQRSLEPPTTSTTKLEVANLGVITGWSYNDGECTQFLGIPYAQIPGRFRRSVPVDKPWPNNSWDGTKLGPYCPQPPRDFYPVPDPPKRTWLNSPQFGELDCLNLNISIPRHDASKGPLPVMVFFHGGAFTYSTGSSPIYDGRLMATSSALDHNTPTIVITLNYRIGVYGFLGGTDLQKYAAAHGDTGCGNYGLWDQVLALRWIQEHIRAFGGDPRRVCIFGQSAGALSVACHLARAEPLFESASIMSGRLGPGGVLSQEEYQIVFEKILTECAISLDKSPVERVEALAAVPEAQLTKAMAPVFGIPVITMALCDDGVLLPSEFFRADRKIVHVPDFVKRVMIGDAVHEAIIWSQTWRHLSAQEILETMKRFMGNRGAKIVAGMYGIENHTPPDTLFSSVERMTTGGLYRISNYFNQLAVKNCYAYHFDVPSPYDNAWGGLAHHSFDNVLIFGVLRHTLPEEQQKISQQMTRAWIRFANGIEPWESFNTHGRFCVFGPEDVGMKSKEEYDAKAYRDWEALDKEGLVGPLTELSEELCLRKGALLATED